MPELIEAYWPYLLIGFAIGVAVAWFIFVSTRRASVVGEKKDVLDEGAERAGRNQALIDAEPSAPNVTAPADPVQAASADPAPVQTAADLQPAASAASGQAAPSPAATEGDDLTRIKGLGPKLAGLMHSLGVTTFSQIAAWDDAEIDRIDSQLGRFQGRIRRDNWVEQARLLSSGSESAFTDQFGRNG